MEGERQEGTETSTIIYSACPLFSFQEHHLALVGQGHFPCGDGNKLQHWSSWTAFCSLVRWSILCLLSTTWHSLPQSTSHFLLSTIALFKGELLIHLELFHIFSQICQTEHTSFCFKTIYPINFVHIHFDFCTSTLFTFTLIFVNLCLPL